MIVSCDVAADKGADKGAARERSPGIAVALATEIPDTLRRTSAKADWEVKQP